MLEHVIEFCDRDGHELTESMIRFLHDFLLPGKQDLPKEAEENASPDDGFTDEGAVSISASSSTAANKKS